MRRRWRSHRPDEGVSLLAGRKLDGAAGASINKRDGLRLRCDGLVIETRPALFDEAPRLAVGRRQSASHQELEGGDAALKLGARHVGNR